MSVEHHPEPETLVAYSGGSLPAALAIVVGSHLEFCEQCRAELARLESVGGGLLERISPMPVAASRRDQIFASLDQHDGVEAGLSAIEPKRSRERAAGFELSGDSAQMPKVLQRILPASDYASLPWRWVGPGVRMMSVDCGEGKLVMLNISAGRKMPVHSHRGNELTLILQGGYSDALGQFNAGDVADLDGRVQHQPVADDDMNCICVAGLDDKLQFKGWIARLLQPFVGL